MEQHKWISVCSICNSTGRDGLNYLLQILYETKTLTMATIRTSCKLRIPPTNVKPAWPRIDLFYEGILQDKRFIIGV